MHLSMPPGEPLRQPVAAPGDGTVQRTTRWYASLSNIAPPRSGRAVADREPRRRPAAAPVDGPRLALHPRRPGGRRTAWLRRPPVAPAGPAARLEHRGDAAPGRAWRRSAGLLPRRYR